ncbi:integrase/recombinase xerD homolog [Anolis sagrei]|uniref:integrase/recombinase xerD homolog n=1 Tax=Anolis sagrei TaxID=38937 RepID=UPI003520739C
MPPRKNVGGPKGKGPAKKAPAKRPLPPSVSSSEDEGVSAADLDALAARVIDLEKSRGLTSPAAGQRPARDASKAARFKALLSRVSSLEADREARAQGQVVPTLIPQPTTVERPVPPAPEEPQHPLQLEIAVQTPVPTAPIETTLARTIPSTSAADGAFSTSSAQRRPLPGTHARPSLAGWDDELIRGMAMALAPNSRKAYLRTVREFIDFRNYYNLPNTTPVPYEHVAQFCIYSKRRGLTPHSIRTKLAALAYWFKAQGLPDHTNDFRLHKLMAGWSRQYGRPTDDRQPMTPDILKGLLKTWPSICSSKYEQLLFHAAALTAFFAALRVSELVAASKNDKSQKALIRSDITMSHNCLEIYIRSSKTDQESRGSVITLTQCSAADLCPIQALSQYIAARKPSQGYFFCHQDGSPLTRYQFWTITSKALKALGLPQHKFGTHSFRIGAASTASGLGYGSETIKSLGRWKSNAYKSYVRPCSI